ncbi:hypothetical protein [Phenylobacterium sp. Root700]|uniref:hypothetical protein n=1 Tax=Phenylobacterium sp. Root700 TaxID=1736591 RepID=UPI000ABE2EA8|nr:hypothetical protein [Phenylobacterium sp. Root700]
MSWCDKLASTPTVGFRLEPHIASGDAIVDSLSPILGRMVDGEKLLFEIEKHETLGISLITHNGFRYAVDQGHIHIAFNHRLRAVPVSGGLPTLEMLSQAQPYSKLLPETFERLIEATSLLPNIRNRTLNRVGAVSSTLVTEEDLPPGIQQAIKYLGRPWGNAPEHFTFSGNYVLDDQEEWTDKCSHTISRNGDNEGLLQITFDWGRHFKKPRQASLAHLKHACAEAEKKSLSYLEEIAEGIRFDENLNSSSV